LIHNVRECIQRISRRLSCRA